MVTLFAEDFSNGIPSGWSFSRNDEDAYNVSVVTNDLPPGGVATHALKISQTIAASTLGMAFFDMFSGVTVPPGMVGARAEYWVKIVHPRSVDVQVTNSQGYGDESTRYYGQGNPDHGLFAADTGWHKFTTGESLYPAYPDRADPYHYWVPETYAMRLVADTVPASEWTGTAEFLIANIRIFEDPSYVPPPPPVIREWPRSDDFEQGDNDEVVTTENTVFDGIWWDPAPVLESEAIFTTEHAHSGTKSITAIPNNYTDLHMGYNQSAVTTDPEDFSFWMRAEPDQTNPDYYSYIYVMTLAADGAIREEEYDYRGVAVFVMGHETDPTKVRWWVEFEDGEWTEDGGATQVIIETPFGAWVKINPKIDAAGNMSVIISDVDNVVYGTAVSPVSGLAQRYSPPQYFCFHTITVVNDQPWGHVWLDDVNLEGGVVTPPAPTLQAPVILATSSTKESVKVSWAKAASGREATGFQVRINGGPAITLPEKSRSYTFWSLPSATQHLVEVRAFDTTESSAWVSRTESTSALVIFQPPVPSPGSGVPGRLIWFNKEAHYETGLDRGVLYPQGGPGVAWNGLVSVDDAHVGGEVEALYSDGIKYLDLPSGRNYQATLTAYSTPDEFAPCNGELSVREGLIFTRQPRQRFGFSYRTVVGDDLGYKIHLVYNALATPTGRGYRSRSSSPAPNNNTWQIDAVPVISPAPRPTAHFILDSTKIGAEPMAAIEGLLYGTDDRSPYLPSIGQINAIANLWNPQIIIPDYVSGVSDLVDGMGDVQETDVAGVYISLPDGRLSETGVAGLYQLTE